MTLRRLLPLLTLLALLVAPFGRIAVADAMARSHHAPAATAGHCDQDPTPDRDKSDKVDCMMACAAMAMAADSPHLAKPPAALVPEVVVAPIFSGLHPESEPPPPRIA